MFNRRFLRIKVFQALFSFKMEESDRRSVHELNLLKTPLKTYDLYIFLLSFAHEFKYSLLNEVHSQNAKHFPDFKIINPLNALIQNQAITKLEEDQSLKEKYKSIPAKWSNKDDLYKNVFTFIRSNGVLDEYMKIKEPTLIDDRKLLVDIYEILILDSEEFNNFIEEYFMNWEDDQTIVASALIKTIKTIKEKSVIHVIEKKEINEKEDTEFMKDLFRQTIENDNSLEKLISENTKNWESERIALSDMILMKMALCEIICFPQIPVKVSINEYLELAKQYSTPNSHGFINGILDKIQITLREENKIVKTGRGLVENVNEISS